MYEVMIKKLRLARVTREFPVNGKRNPITLTMEITVKKNNGYDLQFRVKIIYAVNIQ
jgi:hypothetical protein